MFVTGPDVVKTVTHEDVTNEELGGADAHAGKSGVAHFAHDRELAACGDPRAARFCRRTTWTTRRAGRHRPARPAEEALLDIVPDKPNKPYDMHDVHPARRGRRRVLRGAARTSPANILVGFARLGGHSVGIVANQPAVLAGVLDIDARIKAARFVRFCDASTSRSSPSRTCPASCPGMKQEHGGIIKHGAKLLYAYCEATVPKLTVITRKAYGGAYDVMSSKHIRGDFNFAWPTAEIAVMGPEGAVEILYRKEIAEATIRRRRPTPASRSTAQKFANPYIAAARGYVDEVIEPRETRPRLIDALETLQSKRDRTRRRSTATSRSEPTPIPAALPPSAADVRMFSKVLVANRGEIALRIVRACQRAGVRPSPSTPTPTASAARARGRRGGATSARRRRRRAISSATGSSKWRSASAPRRSIRATASSPSARVSREPASRPGWSSSGRPPRRSPPWAARPRPGSRVIAAGVPVVPGHDRGAARCAARPRAIAERFGYPVLLKAAAGGGGKGMRVVREREETGRRARGGAARGADAFGDDAVYVEKYIDGPRHVEIQVLGRRARHGAASRRARVLDPAAPPEDHRGGARAWPSTPELRARMGETAVAAARAAGYVNAGTSSSCSTATASSTSSR